MGFQYYQGLGYNNIDYSRVKISNSKFINNSDLFYSNNLEYGFDNCIIIS